MGRTFDRSRTATVLGIFAWVVAAAWAIDGPGPGRGIPDAAAQEVEDAGAGLLLTHVSVVDVVSTHVVENQNILVQGRMIAAITDADAKPASASAHAIDLRGAYVIPGLIESHTHITGEPEAGLGFALAYGITSVRDMGGDGEYLRDLQDAIQKGDVIGPDVYFSALMGGRDSARHAREAGHAGAVRTGQCAVDAAGGREQRRAVNHRAGPRVRGDGDQDVCAPVA